LPPLAFDHDAIVSMAHKRLVSKLNYSTIALQFMPEKFTLSELQGVHEIIQGEAVDKRNFRKRILAYKCIRETGDAKRNGNHRPARLYTHTSPGTIEFIK
jgi:8-oxo-dGTP diphosphatase